MSTISIYIAILTSRKLSDILVVKASEAEAVAQCRQWLHTASGAKEEAIPGLCFYAQYGTQDETVRVERHMLELPEVPDDEAWVPTLTLPSHKRLLTLDLDPTAREVPHG